VVEWWWHGQDPAIVGDHHLPPAFVEHPVMAVAEQHGVLGGGLAALDPVLQVVRLAP
jgi:hypothetical protein